jgi:hypothetical protein
VRTLISILSFVLSTSYALSDNPTTGLLYNLKESNSLQYDCTLSGDLLNCNFIQNFVRKKGTESDLKTALADLKDKFNEQLKDLEKECPQVKKMVDALESGKVPKGSGNQADFDKFMAEATPIQKKDLNESIAAMQRLCNDRSEPSMRAFIEINHNKNFRTCKVGSYRFQQSFKKIDNSETWVVFDVEGPTGECGIINVSRFEKSSDFYNYYSKKFISNKEGASLGLITCSGLDENEYIFSWKSKET